MVTSETRPTAMPVGETGNDASPESGSSTQTFICLKVKDVLGMTSVDTVQRLVYTEDTTFQTLFEDVAQKFGMAVADFDLTYQDRVDLYELSGMPQDLCITAANLLPSRQKEYSISLSTRSKKNRQKYLESITRNLESSFDSLATEGSPRSMSGSGGGGGVVSDLDTSHNVTINDDSLDQDNILEGPRRREFVGLKNTTMTCYLTSLTQGLYFTPSFRNLIFSHVVDPDPRKRRKSIVFPLQKIFLQLQFSTRDAIETDELTRTFGWTDRDTWQQHDIQELCSVLMEMLNNEFKGTLQDGIINALYFGSLTDYVKCLECNNFRHKPEEFLVLPLPIRKPNRRSLDYPTLEEALKTFTTPELLDGNNQYRCEKCGKPCDAHKGYLFKTLPSIFSVQLKRFDSDFETNRRYKLNDQIIFPVALDMNPYMDTSESTQQKCEDQGQGQGQDEAAPATSAPSVVNMHLLKPTVDAELPRKTHSRPGVELTVEEEPSNDAGVSNGSGTGETPLDLGSRQEAVVARLKELKETSGPNVYELFAVFVHRGGLAGGHYFAYIKDFETYRWYRCDDSSVRPAREEDIKATFGDVKDTDQTSAYMLMYQRYDEDNVLPFLHSQLPRHVLDTWETLMEHDQKAKDDDTLEKTTIRMTVKYKPYKSWETRSEEVVILKSLNTKQVAHLAFRTFFPDVPSPPSDHIRVCRYDLDLGVIENSFEDEEHYLIYALKHPPPVAKTEGLILEVKNEGDIFPAYHADDLVFVTLQTEWSQERVSLWEEFHAQSITTVGRLRETIALKWRIDQATLQLGLQSKGDIIVLLDDDNIVLADFIGTRINRLFAESLPLLEHVPRWVDFVTSFVHILDYVVQVQRLPVVESTTADSVGLNQSLGENSSGQGGRLSNIEGMDVRIVVSAIPLPSHNCSISTDNCSNNDSINTEPCSEVATSLSPGSGTAGGESTEPETPLDLSTQKVAEQGNPCLQNGTSTSIESPDAGGTPSAVKGPTTTITITSPPANPSTENEWIPLTVNLDCRVAISTLSRGLSEILVMSEDLYSFFYFNKDNEEVEITDYSRSMKDYVIQGGTLRLRFCQRLQANEGRAAVFLLNFSNLLACGNYLGDAILHPSMTTDQAKQAVLQQCHSALGGGLSPEKCRLRRKLPSERISKVFRDGIPVAEWIPRIHEAEIYLQVYEEPSITYPQMDRDTFSVCLRRWQAQTWVLEPPFEVTLYHDHSCEVAELIYKAASETMGISLEAVELARVEAPFPYALNPLAIQELEWFSATSPAKKPLYLYNDELVIFVRDGAEPRRLCTLAEENEFRSSNETMDHRYGSSPRREIGIRINLNLSKTPESGGVSSP